MAPTPPTRVNLPRAAKKKINYTENSRAKKQKDGELIKKKTTPKKIAKPTSSNKRGKKVPKWKTQAPKYGRWGSSKFFYPFVLDDEGNSHMTDDPWHDEEDNEVPSKDQNWFGVVAMALEGVDAKNRRSLNKRGKTDWARRWRDDDWAPEMSLFTELLEGGELRHLVDVMGLFSDVCVDEAIREGKTSAKAGSPWDNEPSPASGGEQSEDSQNITEADRYRAWGASPFSMPMLWNRDGTFRVISAPWKDEEWNDVEPKGDWDALVTDTLKEIDEKNGTDWAKKDKKKMFQEDWCEAFKRGRELRELVEKELVSERKVEMWESERRMGINRVKPDWDDDFEMPHEKGYIGFGTSTTTAAQRVSKTGPFPLPLPKRVLPYSEDLDEDREAYAAAHPGWEESLATFLKACDAKYDAHWYKQWKSGNHSDEWFSMALGNGKFRHWWENDLLHQVYDGCNLKDKTGKQVPWPWPWLSKETKTWLKEVGKGRESSKKAPIAVQGNPQIVSPRPLILPARLLPYSENEDKSQDRYLTAKRQFEKNVAAFCKAHDARNNTTWYTQWNSGVYHDEWLIMSSRNGALKELVEDGFLGEVRKYGWEKIQQDGSEVKIPYDVEEEGREN